MSAYQEQLMYDRRLCILRLLTEYKGTANESILHSGLKALGHAKLGRSAVRTDIRFLIDVGCLTDEFMGDVQVVSITKRGVEVADGCIEVDGIKPPSIGV